MQTAGGLVDRVRGTFSTTSMGERAFPTPEGAQESRLARPAPHVPRNVTATQITFSGRLTATPAPNGGGEDGGTRRFYARQLIVRADGG